LFATIVSTAIAIVTVKLLEKRWPVTAALSAAAPARDWTALKAPDEDVTGTQSTAAPADTLREEAARAYPMWVALVALAGVAALIPLTVFYGKEMAPWIVPGLMVGFLGFGVARRVKVYEAFVEGAKEGFQVALRIIPYLVAILVAIAMLRSSGVMDAVIGPISAVTAPLGLPAEGLTMGLLRMLSGSGAFGYMVSLFQDPAIGPDSYTGYLVSTIQGSTETTFYVLAVYFGAVQVRRVRHALAAGIIADVASLAASVAICFYLFGR
jgi:spore maturation protein SpmB